jgi:hypothetical protein
MECEDDAAVVIPIGIAAGKASSSIHAAGEAVNAAVIVLAATSIMLLLVFSAHIMIRPARHVAERSEVVIKRVVFLHDNDNVFGLMRVA